MNSLKKEDDSKKSVGTGGKPSIRNFTAAPSKTLNIVNVQAAPTRRDWVKRADQILETAKESRKVRKKRLWLERKEGRLKKEKKEQPYLGNWEYLPDLCLELIFQYLSFEVSCLFIHERLRD